MPTGDLMKAYSAFKKAKPDIHISYKEYARRVRQKDMGICYFDDEEQIVA